MEQTKLRFDSMPKKLKEMFDIQTSTAIESLKPYIEKVVAYKPELLTDAFVKEHGSVCRTNRWTVDQVELSGAGLGILRCTTKLGRGPYSRIIPVDHVYII